MPVETPCAKAARLRELRTAIATGEGVQRIQSGDESVAYHSANLALLEREIAEADRLCAVSEGRSAKRSRFAITGGMRRPY